MKMSSAISAAMFTALLLVLPASIFARHHRQHGDQSIGPSVAAMTSTEQRAANELFHAANQDRARHNLPPLKMDPALTNAAWQHGQRMVPTGKLSHDLPGEPDLILRVQKAGVHCSTVAENLAEAPDASTINTEWMHSPLHRANLLDPRVDSVGIAVIKLHGELYAVQDFAREVKSMTVGQEEQQVASLLTSKGLKIQGDTALAKSYCGNAPMRRKPLPRLIMQYSSTDLSRLPPQAEKGISSHAYHRAIVGACPAAHQNGFTAYQMVILFY